MTSHRGALFAAIVVTVLWSSSWVIIRIGLDDAGLEPLTFAGLRYGTAALLLAGIAASRTRWRREVAALHPAHVARLAVLGVVFVTIAQGAQFIALDSQPAATTSLVLSMTPLLVAAASCRTLAEAPTTRQVAGAAVVAAGAAVYFSGSFVATAVGMTAALVGLGSNVSSSLLGRWVNRLGHSSPLVTTTVSMVFGGLLLFGVGLWVEGIPAVSMRGAVVIGWLAVVNTALAFTLWNHSLRHLSATESSVINNTMLVQIALLAWLFLDEPPSLRQAIGILAVTAGVIWSQHR